MTTASGDNRLYCFSLSCNDHRIPKLESIQKHCPSQWDAELGEECYKWTVQEDFTTELRRSVEKDIANLKMGKDLRPHMTPYASPQKLHDAKGRKRARSPSESSSESESESEGTKAKKAKLQAKEQQAAEKKKEKEDAALKKKQEQEEAKKEREAAMATRRDAAATQRAEAAANKKATKQAELDKKKSKKQAMF